ncbi:hypothetical protein P389DRAFT_143836 [Cystobasidium minutum MCA 4210]|uniref:uncharacterized protein n=1 Tax=Cystobasidium minutum MCA 4210 TaxID=1397322 RepID=UPI0034CE9927|eukprot:jgi/Rhomi1/143836/e_gw1.4.1670.1
MIYSETWLFLKQYLPYAAERASCGECERLFDSQGGSPLISIRSKHILNAQVSIRSHCCRKWFDCAECHAESESHPLAKANEMIFACKKCKKTFRKDMTVYDEADEYCPHCDNHYVREAKTPQAMLVAESEDSRVDSRCV